MKTPIGLTATLPTIDLFKESICLLWQKRVQVIKMFLPIVALLAFIDWGSEQFFDMNNASQSVLAAVISTVFSVLFATAAHQFTLLPEKQIDYSQAIRLWGKSEFRYLLRALQIGIIVSVFLLLIVFSIILANSSLPLAFLVGFSVVALALYIWSRLSIVLPEAALGKPTSLKRAWGLSEGNGIGLCMVVVIIPCLIMLPFIALFFVEHPVVNYLAALGIYVTTLISLVALSLSYRFLSDFYDGQELTA